MFHHQEVLLVGSADSTPLRYQLKAGTRGESTPTLDCLKVSWSSSGSRGRDSTASATFHCRRGPRFLRPPLNARSGVDATSLVLSFEESLRRPQPCDVPREVRPVRRSCRRR